MEQINVGYILYPPFLVLLNGTAQISSMDKKAFNMGYLLSSSSMQIKDLGSPTVKELLHWKLVKEILWEDKWLSNTALVGTLPTL